MGVTGQRRNPYRADQDDDSASDDLISTYLEDSINRANQCESSQTPVKKLRKYRPRYWYTENTKAAKTRHGVRATRRADHLNQLMITEGLDLDDCEFDLLEIVEPSVTHFTELFIEKEKMMMWNDFINRSEEEQQRLLSGMSWDSDADDDVYDDVYGDVLTSAGEKDQWEKIDISEAAETWEHVEDEREVHPGFSSEECFKRIDGDLRKLLRRRHLPKGTLSNLEDQLVNFFKEWPSSIYVSKLPSSYERLLTHALCQYLDLKSKSFDDNHGVRQTQVENPHVSFFPPAESLTQYLETKH